MDRRQRLAILSEAAGLDRDARLSAPARVGNQRFFLTLRGRRLATSLPPRQLRLFAPGQHLTQAAWKTTTPPCAYR
jgi:hypothetical protein